MAWSFGSLAGLIIPVLAIALTTLFIFIKKLLLMIKPKSCTSSKLPHPPGPPGRPLVGSIFDLGEIPHQTFYNLQAKYGPVIWLKLGFTNTMVVQSAEAAAELFKKCDRQFSDRKLPNALTAFGYNQGSVVIGAYGDYWRKLRRICTVEFLVQKRVNKSSRVRQDCVDEMIEWIKRDIMQGSGEIQLFRYLFVTAFDVIGNVTVDGARLDKAGEFFEAFLLFMEWIGKPNVADFFPVLKWLDPQGIRRNTAKYLEKLLGFASEIVRVRILERENNKDRDHFDFLDALLDEGEVYEDGADKLSLKNITIVILEMFMAGTDTTSTTMEWGMTEFLRHPEVMKKIQDELDRVVGRTRKVQEKDLPQMPFLQAAVKETMRLHPAVQMLLPRNSMEDTVYMGYIVPKNTQILVNAWAIHRDPTAWTDPLAFKPERFLDSDVDFKGQDFQMIPFGSGRRSCLGMTIGHRMVCLTIASLLQTFDWKLAGGIGHKELDMRETMGLTCRKKVPLKVIPSLRAGIYFE